MKIVIWPILVFFCTDVLMETCMQINNTFKIDESEAKDCLLKFINSKCSVHNPDDTCEKMLNCICRINKFNNLDFVIKICNLFFHKLKKIFQSQPYLLEY